MRNLLIIAGAAALLATACGGSRGEVTVVPENGAQGVAANGAQVQAAPEVLTDGQAVEVAMTEFAFTPATLTVKAGSTVTFSFTNRGGIVHEAVIGDEQAQEEHEAAMTEGMEMQREEGAAEAAELELQPGESGTLTYTFSEPGTYLIGCHEPGHYEAGMVATIEVVA